MLYNEDKQISAKFRKDYFDSIVKMTEMRQAEADRNRAEYISPGTVAAFREEYRKDLTAYIGWPLTEYDSFKDVLGTQSDASTTEEQKPSNSNKFHI